VKEKVTLQSAFVLVGGVWSVPSVVFSLNFGGCLVLWVGERVKESITLMEK
jgi:hypothetical protein